MTAPDSPKLFRIASFNVENLDDPPHDGPKLENRIRILRPQLLRTRADVLCLQEVNGQPATNGGKRNLEALNRLIEGTPYEDFTCVSTVRTSHGAPRDKHNLVILSRFPVISHKQIHNDFILQGSCRRGNIIR